MLKLSRTIPGRDNANSALAVAWEVSPHFVGLSVRSDMVGGCDLFTEEIHIQPGVRTQYTVPSVQEGMRHCIDDFAGAIDLFQTDLRDALNTLSAPIETSVHDLRGFRDLELTATLPHKRHGVARRLTTHLRDGAVVMRLGNTDHLGWAAMIGWKDPYWRAIEAPDGKTFPDASDHWSAFVELSYRITSWARSAATEVVRVATDLWPDAMRLGNV